MLTDLQIKNILKECDFKTSRSGGKGGQNVNKLETKVEITFNLLASESLSLQEKETIIRKKPELSVDGTIKIVSSKYRSQLENKQDAKNKLIVFLNKLLKPTKKRLATKPSKASREKKIESKKRRGEIKSLRKKLF